MRLSVRDTGCGLNADTLDHLFEPFFTTKELGKGTGLGLAISKKLAQLMGGEVGVESTLGQGSCFWAQIPLELGAVQPARVLPAGPLQQGRVLVVDDNEAAATVLCEQLTSLAQFSGTERGVQCFDVNVLPGVCSVAFVFLPGSQFDFYGFPFVKTEEAAQ